MQCTKANNLACNDDDVQLKGKTRTSQLAQGVLSQVAFNVQYDTTHDRIRAEDRTGEKKTPGKRERERERGQ